MGYHFSCLHRAACMMIYVDCLSRRFGVAMAQHLGIAALLHKIDIVNRANAYNSSIGHTKNVAQLEPSSEHQDVQVPVYWGPNVTVFYRFCYHILCRLSTKLQ